MSRGVPGTVFGSEPDLGRPAPPSARRTRHQTAAALANVPLFTGLASRQLRALAAASDQVTFDPGQRIVEEGRPGEAMYVILAGRAKVSRGDHAVASLWPGEFFGELSAIDGGPRTATVTAETPVSTLRLFRATLRDTIEADPTLAVRLLEGMSRRLRQIQSPA